MDNINEQDNFDRDLNISEKNDQITPGFSILYKASTLLSIQFLVFILIISSNFDYKIGINEIIYALFVSFLIPAPIFCAHVFVFEKNFKLKFFVFLFCAVIVGIVSGAILLLNSMFGLIIFLIFLIGPLALLYLLHIFSKIVTYRVAKILTVLSCIFLLISLPLTIFKITQHNLTAATKRDDGSAH
jgi:hypothetical protein